MDRKKPFARLGHKRFVAGLVTGLFVVVGTLLAGLIFVGIYSMTLSTNALDKDRMVRSVYGSVSAMHSGMQSTLRDNSIWDAAYTQVYMEDASEWAFDTWGIFSEDSPLYNVAAVIGPNNEEVMAAKDGVPFISEWYFDPEFKQLLERVRKTELGTVSEFVRTKTGVSIVGASLIVPTTSSIKTSKPLYTLVFSKELSPTLLGQISNDFDLPDLRFTDEIGGTQVGVPITSGSGETLGYLTWRTTDPGSRAYEQVRPIFIIAFGILVFFLTSILYVGQSVVRNLKVSGENSQYRATHDALSGLLNRSGLVEALVTEIENYKSEPGDLFLYLMDLDGFKAVNDNWGHAIGDDLICTVASHLKNLTPRNALVARLGGDEFVVVVRETSETPHLSEPILAIFNAPFLIKNLTIEVGVSVGIVHIKDKETDVLELVRRADVALYRAKETGRGRSVIYTESFDSERLQQLEFEDQLRTAIANRSVDVHFQPLFNAQTRTITGVEALARWSLPTGRITPDVFIPLAERAGLIDALGALVLSRALDAALNWPDLEVSVNVSPLQLRNPTFTQTVKDILKTKNFEPSRLILEITENVLISFPEQAKRSIDALQAIGVKFALDDFGCGYASLGALKEFHFDRMKIDRSLVRALDESADGPGILHATVSLANALHVPVTAEGIETEAQAITVTNSGCDVLQGYLLGKPMASEEVTKLLMGQSGRRVA